MTRDDGSIHHDRHSAARNWASFLIPALIFLCGIAFFAARPFSLTDYPLDDAWIHRVYARSVAHGDGFAYNPGVQEAGSTSPLWAVVTAPAHWFEPLGTKAVVIVAKIVAVLLGLVSLRIVQGVGQYLGGSRASGVVAASLFALEPRFLFSTLSGMETPLLLMLWLSATLALIHKRWALSLILFGLSAVTRPEALILLPVCFLAWFLIAGRKERGVFRKSLGIICCLPALLWAVFCEMVTGHWLPNTFYLKAQSFHLGGDQFAIAWSALRQHGIASVPVFVVGVAAGAAFGLLRARRSVSGWLMLLFLLGVPLVYFLGVAGTREISLSGYYWTRWIDPVALVLTVLTCIGIALLLSATTS
ncbi:hypothetical protein ACFL6M_07870, partial [Candidatus Eisenbacteria bacterium]